MNLNPGRILFYYDILMASKYYELNYSVLSDKGKQIEALSRGEVSRFN